MTELIVKRALIGVVIVFVALTAPLLARLREDRTLRAALSGLNAASLALMMVACVPLAAQAFARPLLAVPLFLASFVALVHWRVNSAWLVLAGAIIGLLAA